MSGDDRGLGHDPERRGFVIVDRSGRRWPGALAYRSMSSRKGYSTREEAAARLRRVEAHYNAKHGCSPGVLSVVSRWPS